MLQGRFLIVKKWALVYMIKDAFHECQCIATSFQVNRLLGNYLPRANHYWISNLWLVLCRLDGQLYEREAIERLPGARSCADCSGNRYSVAVIRTGHVWAWGSGFGGSLGFEDFEGLHHFEDYPDAPYQRKPILASALQGQKVVQVACGAAL